MHRKKIVILGSTGVIGKTVLTLCNQFPDHFEVIGLAAKENVDLLIQQIHQFAPKEVALFDEQKCAILRQLFPHIPIHAHVEGLSTLSTMKEADMVVIAIPGSAGITPTFHAIESGKSVALASKEVAASAGKLLKNLSLKHKKPIIPIDSELTSLFHLLQKAQSPLKKVTLTASGGPLLHYPEAKLPFLKKEEVLSHPNWECGAKSALDSSNMLNKGLELLAAHFLFDIPQEKIEIVIHPESRLHAMIELSSGMSEAILFEPNMVIPTLYALSYPDPLPPPTSFFLGRQKELRFQEESTQSSSAKQLGLTLAKKALQLGESAPCFLVAAAEALSSQYLLGNLSWIEIGKTLEILILEHPVKQLDSLKVVLEVEKEAIESVQLLMTRI